MRLKTKLLLIILTAAIYLINITVQCRQKKKIRELTNQIEEIQRRNQIDRETIQQIENISTGDIEHDFNAGLDELRKLAENRRK